MNYLKKKLFLGKEWAESKWAEPSVQIDLYLGLDCFNSKTAAVSNPQNGVVSSAATLKMMEVVEFNANKK